MKYQEYPLKYDLIVIGGGLSGVAAAVAAARDGASVLLAEQDGSLGGAMFSNFIYPFMPYHYVTPEGNTELLNAGIFGEMLQRHKDMGGVSDRGWQPEIFRIMLDELAEDAGVNILFHARLIDVVKNGDEIRSVKVSTKSGIMNIPAQFFIDATGDGELLALAGCAYQLGRENDNLCQPMTTCFRISNIDMEKYRKEIAGLQALYKEKRQNGEITNPREDILIMPAMGQGVLHFNTTRIVKRNPVDPFELSCAEREARRQVLEMYNFLCENSEAFKNSSLISIAQNIGVRESRKLCGMYILTADDLKSMTIFEDSIALGNYEIDIHNPEGTGTYHYHFPANSYYSIPYRSLLPREITNMLVAGRCLSATHEAHSAVRIMPICTCMGEAAGTAASEAIRSGKNAHTLDIRAVQDTLCRNGAKIR